MNERIQELEKQSYTEFMHELGGRYMAFDKQKFAELIVRECLDVIAMRIYLGPAEICRQECKALASEIKEHFGVEE
jgi:hypothetical protein